MLKLTEREILTMPCWCLCCSDVEAIVVDLAPGTYTVEYCWDDWETGSVVCYTETVVLP